MPEAKKAEPKTYRSVAASFSMSRPVEGKLKPIAFEHNEFVSSDKAEQDYIEESVPFKGGVISIKESPLEAAQRRASKIRAKADAAVAEAVKAEKEVALLSPKPEGKKDEKSDKPAK